MKQIPLRSKKYPGLFAIVDDDDYERVKQYTWLPNKKPKCYYATSKINGKMVKLHRVILGVTDPKQMVDHIDHDGLNNQRNNLRLCTNTENQHNQKKHRDNKSGFKGVWWNKRHKKWRSRIQIKGKEHYLGAFATPEEAHDAYVKAAKELQGEFCFEAIKSG